MKKIIILFLAILFLAGGVFLALAQDSSLKSSPSSQETSQFTPPQLEPRYYYLQLSYEEKEKKFTDKLMLVRLGKITSSAEEKDFVAQLFSLDDKLLETVYFTPQENFVLKVPYHYNGKVIKIFAQDNLQEALASFNVQVFAKVCGNGTCEGHESYEDCPQDCPSGGQDDYCDHQKDGICDPDCHNWQEADPDCSGHKPIAVSKQVHKQVNQQVSQNNSLKKSFFSNKKALSWSIILIVLVIGVGGIVWIVLKR